MIGLLDMRQTRDRVVRKEVVTGLVKDNEG